MQGRMTKMSNLHCPKWECPATKMSKKRTFFQGICPQSINLFRQIVKLWTYSSILHQSWRVLMYFDKLSNFGQICPFFLNIYREKRIFRQIVQLWTNSSILSQLLQSKRMFCQIVQFWTNSTLLTQRTFSQIA